jgi:hypothetical protein
MKLVISFLIVCFVSVGALSQTSPNLVNANGLTGTTATTSTGGGYSGGSTPGFNSTTNTIMFGYTAATARFVYGFNTALQNSGMSITGYNYAWQYLNQGMSSGSLSGNIAFTGIDGTQLHSKTISMGTTTDWTTINGTETFATPFAASRISSFGLSFTGRDNRYWAGYYGPQVKDPSLSLNYTFDQCATNPLSSPSCPGYQAAYTAQQCTSNPLYDSSCPGYQTAYFTQQCNANPLYASSCPGYAAAYKTQQCTASPLYATDCPGYATAYKTQQCTASPLYATDCPGYAQAYLNSQCIIDSLYSRLCSGYATAYAIKYLAPLDTTTASAVNGSLSATAAVKASDPVSINTNGIVSTAPSATGNSTVDSVISTPSTTSTTGVTSVTSVTSVINPPPPPGGSASTSPPPPAPPAAPPPAQAAAQAIENKKTDTAVASVEKKSGGNAENAKKEATAKAKELANEAGKAATLEAQAATQGIVVGLMGYVPGFNAYQNSIVPDVNIAKMTRQYNKPVIDNRNAQRRLSGASDSKWQEMVDSQYKLGN